MEKTKTHFLKNINSFLFLSSLFVLKVNLNQKDKEDNLVPKAGYQSFLYSNFQKKDADDGWKEIQQHLNQERHQSELLE